MEQTWGGPNLPPPGEGTAFREAPWIRWEWLLWCSGHAGTTARCPGTPVFVPPPRRLHKKQLPLHIARSHLCGRPGSHPLLPASSGETSGLHSSGWPRQSLLGHLGAGSSSRGRAPSPGAHRGQHRVPPLPRSCGPGSGPGRTSAPRRRREPGFSPSSATPPVRLPRCLQGCHQVWVSRQEGQRGAPETAAEAWRGPARPLTPKTRTESSKGRWESWPSRAARSLGPG